MIIFIYGDDTFRGSRKIKELKQGFLEKRQAGEDSVSFVNGAEAEIREFNEKISSASLFSSGNKRMIIVEKSFSNKKLEEIVEYFKQKEKSEDQNVVVFWEPGIKTKKKGYKFQTVMVDSSGREKPLTKKASAWFEFLKKQKFVQEFSSFSNNDAAKWAKEEIKKRGADISNKALNYLAGVTGSNLWQLDSEIDKLINYKSGQVEKSDETVEIQLEDVQELVKGAFDEDIFALTDAISNNDKKSAVELLEKQYEAGLSDHYLLNMIVRQIKILLQIRGALDAGENSRNLASSLGLHPFVVQKGMNQVRRFNIQTLKKALNKLVEIDYSLKSGQGEAKTMLDLFILKI